MDALISWSSMNSWLILLLAIVGHGGLHVAIYNRINAFGWPRKRVKRLVRVFFVNTFAVPALTLWFQQRELAGILFDRQSWSTLHPLVLGYGWACLAAWLVFGLPWLVWRPIFGLEWVPTQKRSRVIDVGRTLGRELALTSKARWEARLPLNQLRQLSIEEIELPVAGLPKSLDGYRIAHLSDVHLTGEIHGDYAKYVVEQATRAGPDLIALTGDIIDKQGCIDWLFDIFSPAEAVDGCYFILGNHDTRVVDSWETRAAMDRAGWIDLGSQSIERTLAGVRCKLIGNEHPWFERPRLDRCEAEFRLLLSHSPDQIWWARKHGVELMLAGHTHGGQGRLPLAGPILSPSIHGSRFASGQFFLRPTTMHVTRGIGAVHLMRINCRPELSLLTLRSSDG